MIATVTDPYAFPPSTCLDKLLSRAHSLCEPLGFEAGDANLYRYVGNGPTNATDPSGLVEAYVKNFLAATPALGGKVPPGWQVHHTYQQALAEGAVLPGINVHDAQYLRAVDPKMHKEIGVIQTNFWEQQKQAFKCRKISEVVKNPDFDIELLKKHMKDIEDTYDNLWIKPGATHEEIKATFAAVKEGSDAVSSGRRITTTLNKLGVPLGVFTVFSLITDNVALAKNIVVPDAETQAATNRMLEQYRFSLQMAMDKHSLTRTRVNLLGNSVHSYLTHLKVDVRITNTLAKQFAIIEAECAN